MKTHAGMLEALAQASGRALAPGLATEPIGQAVEHRPVGFAQCLAGAVHGLLEKHLVLGRASKGADVSAVHREMHDQFLQRSPDRAERQIAGHQVVPGHLQQSLGHAFEIPGERAVEDLLARQ
ncbi:hypothetical protein D3C84_760390 [compost metagenome]